MADQSWQDNIITDNDSVRRVLEETKRVAVLGIKPPSRAGQPAYYVPAYLQEVGYDVVPVPTYYPEVEEILGQPVYRSVSEIPGDIDMVNVFRRPRDIPAHVDDLIAKAPRVVWFQLGIRHDEAAKHLAEAGIQVIQNRCTMADHRRFGL